MPKFIPSLGCLIAALGLAAGLASPASAAYRTCAADGSCQTELFAGVAAEDGVARTRIHLSHRLTVQQSSAAGVQGSVGPLGFDPGQSEVRYSSGPNNPYFDWRVTSTLEFPAATGLSVSGDGWESVPASPDLGGLGALPFGGELKARWKNGNTIGVLWHFHRPGQQAAGRPRSQTISLGSPAYKRTTAGPSQVTPAPANPAENVFRTLAWRQNFQLTYDDGTSLSRYIEDVYYD